MGKFAIFLLVLIAGAAGGGSFYLKMEQQRVDLEEKSQSLADVKAEHERRVKQLIPKKQENRDLQTQIDKVSGLTAERDSLTAQIQTLEKNITNLKRDFIQAVIQIREASIGMAWPDVKVSDDQILRNVKIQKITETDVTLANSLGTFRMPAANLPPDMRDRFRIDASPMTDSAALLATGLAPPQIETGAPVGSVPAVMLTNVSESEATLRKQLAKQTELQRTRQAYLAQVQDYREKDSLAKYLGKPMKYQAVIPKIIQAINDLDTQLADLASKIVTLQMQVDDIREGTVKDPAAPPASPR